MKIIPIGFPDAWVELRETKKHIIYTDFSGTVKYPITAKPDIISALDNHFQALQKIQEIIAR